MSFALPARITSPSLRATVPFPLISVSSQPAESELAAFLIASAMGCMEPLSAIAASERISSLFSAGTTSDTENSPLVTVPVLSIA